MALVSGIANFVSNTASTLVTDWLASMAAIATQIGGTVTTSDGVRHVYAGNLDTTNLATNAGFSNAQKAEPFAMLYLTFSGDRNGTSNTQTTIYGAPVPQNCTVASIIVSDAAGGLMAGSFDVKLNGSKIGTFALSDTQYLTNTGSYLQAAGFDLRVGDVIAIEHAFTSSSTNTDYHIIFVCKALVLP